MKVLKAIINTIINILIVLVLVVSILIATLALTSKASGVSTILGYTVQTIQSDSMKGGYQGHTLSNGEKVNDNYTGGNFEKGDVIIGKATDFDSTRTYQKGDIVTYLGVLKGNEDLGEQLICHRITDVQKVGDITVYQTWGDNQSDAQSPDQLEVSDYIPAGSIGAVAHTENYDCTVIHGFGKVLDFIRSQLGFFLCVLLPMIIFFLYELIRVVLNASGYKKAKSDDKLEEEKEALRKEYEEKLKNAGVADNTEVESKSESADTNAPAQPTVSAEEYEQFKQFMAFQNMQKQAQKENTEPTETDSTTDSDSQN